MNNKANPPNLIVVWPYRDFIQDIRAKGSTLEHATECGCRSWFSVPTQEFRLNNENVKSICIMHLMQWRDKYQLTLGDVLPGMKEAAVADGMSAEHFEAFITNLSNYIMQTGTTND